MAKTPRTKKSKSTKKPSQRSKIAARVSSRGGKTAASSTRKKTSAKKTTKKKVVKKTTAKRVTKKKAAKKTVKKAASKKVSKKTATKQKASKKVSKKTATKQKASKKKVSKKKTIKKTSAKKTSKRAASVKKPTTKTSKPVKTAKAPTKTPAKAPAKKSPKPAAESKPKSGDKQTAPNTSPADKKATGRKGITIVSKRPMRRSRTRPKRKPFIIPGEKLLGPGAPVRKPLIPSGPPVTPQEHPESNGPTKPRKTPFGKRDLTKYRKLLLAKRAELFGDVEQIETDALLSESGDLSHFPQHMADQGTDSYEQSLSLDLAAADRRLIKEIDDALQRINDMVYGLCETTGIPIKIARLNELPWARYSIETAREIERRGGA